LLLPFPVHMTFYRKLVSKARKQPEKNPIKLDYICVFLQVMGWVIRERPYK